ncbi:carboxyl transferase domain-containing protein [Actinomycetospora termitidis]|uniref:Carboxyl transferase domain-containing protein n=1 Tax=Actinomycetospora termitidis TaxID=3053470 RepID=A0ABT7M1J8_9PSEU|nr:carboxyl transferase domain-containing protein [Actinomycetospora sp. Odt1-22]MDL5154525.1 carboxyl transferase domain-containing protein [Actinomycetospora sp. Odt1-22]
MAPDELSALTRPVRRIAIVNRGEAAVRLIHAVRDINAERRGRDPIRTIALSTDAEPAAMFVREADEVYRLGAAADRPYLDHDRLAEALVATGADAVWVGWGFVAEDPGFAQRCADLGVTFIGPSAEAMRRLGDKIGAKQLAEESGVPVAPWSGGAVDSLDEALEAATAIGYPLMLKAAAGGGGRGIRTIRGADELRAAFQNTRDEARRAFGSDVVFLERLVTGARHVEVQVIADAHGTAWALGVRDCSIQRRNQKIIEESASPLLTAEQTDELKASAERLAQRVGYCGAGTVEFLYHPGDKTFSFLEVNTRLQVEHPITEVTTGTDLVRLQIHVASGGRLTGPRPSEVGHAVEARLNAEDPDREFTPSPGRIELLELPSGPGVRVDTGVSRGDVIPPDFDSMIAKIIASGRTRDEALARLRRAVSETAVVVEGGVTNKSFVLALLDRPEVIDGSADTGWIDRVRAEGGLVEDRNAGIALVTAAIEAYESEEQVEVVRLLETARGGRPQATHRTARPFDLTLRGQSHRVEVSRIGAQRFRVAVVAGEDGGSDRIVHVTVHPLDAHHRRVVAGGQGHRVLSATHGPVHFVEVDGIAHRVSRDEGGVVRAPAPALVVAAPVAVGEEVAAGAPVLVLESMKMETQLHAPFAGVLRELHVATGSQVETGTPLARLEPLEDPEEAASAEDAAATELDLPDAADDTGRPLDDLVAVLLGYDVGAGVDGGWGAEAVLARYLADRDLAGARGEDVHDDEIGLLAVFADFAELSRNRPADEEARAEMRVHSPREYFHTYLQSLDTERGALPEMFTAKLRSVLAHYGVDDLTRTPELERVVFRVFLAQQRSAPDLAIVTAVLQRWLVEPAIDDDRAPGVRELLDRLVRAMQRRFPAVGDLARSVRYRWFDEPAVLRERGAALENVSGELAYLDEHPDAPDRAGRIEALAATPERVVGLLADRLLAGVPVREPLLDVLTRRHYRGYELHDLRTLTLDGRPGIEADYVLDDRPTLLVSTVGTVDELTADSGLAVALAECVAARRSDQAGVVDLYLAWPDAPEDPEACSAVLRERLGAVPVAQDVRRVAVAVCTPGRPVGYFTIRPSGDGGLVEDDLVRGVHPMVGRRLDLWRLRDFDITRVDAPDDVLLYHAIAKDNPADQRLVALTQVRELAVVRDADGRVSSLPQVERAIADCVEGIRRARATRASKSVPLDMNHVWIHIWPPIEAELEQITALRASIAPITSGAGIDEVLASGRIVTPEGDYPVTGRFYAQPGAGVQYSVGPPPTHRLAPMDDYGQKVMRARRRGTVHPYEVLSVVAGENGTVVEHDLGSDGLAPVQRPPGGNSAGIVVAVVTTPTTAYPEGVTRVVLAGDPTKALGAVSEPECSRIIAALDLAETMRVPVEWYALSAGARIAMQSGTENMDWVARGLKRIIEFTQAGGEIDVVVAGINVGAQPYWNAEATMLMHTKGVLVMTPESAMVLTGKQSLDFSGGVSAEDNFGIGGYDRVMGPNGQAQYWAPDLGSARDIVLAHHEHAYVVPGEDGPRRLPTSDPYDRDITTAPHDSPDSTFTTVGEIFSSATNPDRKKAFDIRTVMRALTDADHPTLERWAGMADADTAVVVDAHLGGHPVCLLGIESRAVPRRGFPPTDGPDTYTAGTLFPKSSKKAARAINAASGNRPVVVLANLSGFDGSPDSMRNVQLEYGAEIGRAVVNFDGPIVFCVISRYHGGAFVVFSKALNPRMTVLAVEGSFASVIGGAPAAAVVFAAEVDKRTEADARVTELTEEVRAADEVERAPLAARLREVRTAVRAEKLGEVAAEFDRVHSIHRAVEVGSVDAVISAQEMRPRIISALG